MNDTNDTNDTNTRRTLLFGDLVDVVEDAAREYTTAHEYRNTSHWKAKRLDVDASTRRIGQALIRLEKRGVVERVSRGANGAAAWRFVDDGDGDES